MSETSNLAVIAILATTVGALVWVIKYLFTKVVPALDGLKQSTEANTTMLKSVSDATEKNTQATTSADDYLRQRNGRDIEFHEAVVKRLDAVPDKMEEIANRTADELRKIKMQDVKEQTVQHQTVKHKDS